MYLDTYIKKYYLSKSDREIAAACGVSRYCVQYRRRKLNLFSPVETVKEKRKRNSGYERDKSFDNIIRKKYLLIPVKTLAREIGKSETFVKTAMKALGLFIPKEIIDKRKAESQIKKGSTPPNKGKKMSPEQYAIASRTFFKKGQTPVNTLPEIAIVIRKDSKGRKYFWFKQGYKNWKMYHVEIWERENGEVPAGHIIVFKDKNSLNCVIENLECITFEENMKRNTIARFPTELRQVINLTHKLNKQIHAKQNS